MIPFIENCVETTTTESRSIIALGLAGMWRIGADLMEKTGGDSYVDVHYLDGSWVCK